MYASSAALVDVYSLTVTPSSVVSAAESPPVVAPYPRDGSVACAATAPVTVVNHRFARAVASRVLSFGMYSRRRAVTSSPAVPGAALVTKRVCAGNSRQSVQRGDRAGHRGGERQGDHPPG